MFQLKKHKDNERKGGRLIHVNLNLFLSLTQVLEFYREVYEFCDLYYNICT